MEHNKRVELLKDVFTLIHPELTSKRNRNGQRDNEERKTRVQTWLKDITQATNHEESAWGGQEKLSRQATNLLPQFMQLLRECILTHQWTQVLAMLDCLSHIPYGADWVTWKAYLTALYTEPEDNTSLIQDFFKQAYLLRECNVRDVALEFVQYLLSQGLTQEASQAIQSTAKVRKGVMQSQQKDFTRHLMDLLDAYQGLIFYVDWKAAISKREASATQTQSQSFYSLVSSQGLSDDAIRSIAQRAILGLDSLPQKAGIWDIFLTKSVEIHEFYQEFDQAYGILRSYRDKNPDNPNAHRFLYELLHKNSDYFDEELVQEETLSCLKSLAKLDPANPLVLTLWQKLTDQGMVSQAVTVIFDLLDNVIWQDKMEGWQCLSKSFTSTFSRESGEEEEKQRVQKEVKRCWTTRRDWWPAYHFCNTSLTTSVHAAHLLLPKCIVAAVLVGTDCKFIQAAKGAMDEDSLEHLDDAVAGLDVDVVRSLHGSDSPQLPLPPPGPRLQSSATFTAANVDHLPQGSSQRAAGHGDFDDSDSGQSSDLSEEYPSLDHSQVGSKLDEDSDDVSVTSSVQSVQWLKKPKTFSPTVKPTHGTQGEDSAAVSSDSDLASTIPSFRSSKSEDASRKNNREMADPTKNSDSSDVSITLSTSSTKPNTSDLKVKRRKQSKDVSHADGNIWDAGVSTRTRSKQRNSPFGNTPLVSCSDPDFSGTRSVTSPVTGTGSVTSPVTATGSVTSPVTATRSVISPVTATRSVTSPVTATRSVISPVTAKHRIRQKRALDDEDHDEFVPLKRRRTK